MEQKQEKKITKVTGKIWQNPSMCVCVCVYMEWRRSGAVELEKAFRWLADWFSASEDE